MNAVDLFVVADKGEAKHDLAELRRRLCEAVIKHDHYRFIEIDDPPGTARRWTTTPPSAPGTASAPPGMSRRSMPSCPTAATSASWSGVIRRSTTRRSASPRQSGGPELDVDLRVVPGISSLQLLAAAHKIVLNQIGQPVHVTTGRRLLEEYTADLGDVLVMLDGGLACADLVPLHPDLTIYWGAQLGFGGRVPAGRPAGRRHRRHPARARSHPRAPWLGPRHLPPAPSLTTTPATFNVARDPPSCSGCISSRTEDLERRWGGRRRIP